MSADGTQITAFNNDIFIELLTNLIREKRSCSYWRIMTCGYNL